MPIIAATLSRLLAQRLAIGLDRQADIAERELRIALGDAEVGRLPTASASGCLIEPDVELAGAARRHAEGARQVQ